ncbi:MAG: hypothetical protein M4D80_06060 [Myxococcota bacterium]|nr:hypothetical protein [Deltaproteobacteria bacterium]MDQ3334704.1 hypothetical protein [Myxococcota bacterium]
MLRSSNAAAIAAREPHVEAELDTIADATCAHKARVSAVCVIMAAITDDDIGMFGADPAASSGVSVGSAVTGRGYFNIWGAPFDGT